MDSATTPGARFAYASAGQAWGTELEDLAEQAGPGHGARTVRLAREVLGWFVMTADGAGDQRLPAVDRTEAAELAEELYAEMQPLIGFARAAAGGDPGREVTAGGEILRSFKLAGLVRHANVLHARAKSHLLESGDDC